MIPLCIPKMGGNEWKYIKDCLDTNWVSSVGSYVDKFEEDFRNYVESENSVVTMNGTSALQLALSSLAIGEGDEVIVPSLTFVASVNPILYVGAKPVFVDVCRDTYVMDVEKIEELITENTKVILPVHLYGYPVEMDGLMKIAKKHNLYVVEDATESLGSIYKGKHTGTIGHVGCFSFNGNKLITTGAGGMLVTNDKVIGEKANYLSNQAKTINCNNEMIHEEVGYNFRMPNILAAMGCAQLEVIDEYVDSKKNNAKYYNELLKDIKNITLPVQKKDVFNVNWLYSIVIEDDYEVSRDEMIELMKQNGIETRPFFYPIHKMDKYEAFRTGDMKNTDELYEKGLCLPSSVSLTRGELDLICEVLK